MVVGWEGASYIWGIKMPTLHYGWSRGLLLAARGLGLGQGPGPELAQLLAAMLSLPQPQPHCAKLLHTYNLLIIHEVFEEVKKKEKYIYLYIYCRVRELVEN